MFLVGFSVRTRGVSPTDLLRLLCQRPTAQLLLVLPRVFYIKPLCLAADLWLLGGKRRLCAHRTGKGREHSPLQLFPPLVVASPEPRLREKGGVGVAAAFPPPETIRE